MEYDSSDRDIFFSLIWGMIWHIVSAGRRMGMLFCVMDGFGAELPGLWAYHRQVSPIANEKEFYRV